MGLKGKRVAILGGSSGIGLAVAQTAAGEGAKVVVASSNSDRLDRALSSLPATSEGRVTNLLSNREVAALFDDLEDFDHLVHRRRGSANCAVEGDRHLHRPELL